MMRADCLLRTPARPWSPNLQTEDKEDSGISPGRSSSDGQSTSPQTGRSPESGGQYSRSPPDTSVPYPHSPNTASSPPDAADSSLERLKMALERSTALASIYKHEPEQKETDHLQETPKKEYACPLCAYSSPYKHRYMEHVSTHYSDKCTLCDFKGQNSMDLRNHLAEMHGVYGGELSDLMDVTEQHDQPSDGQDDDDNPRRNKSKNFRCKQCAFTTSTKVDFWEHTKTHIKAEKLLTCPKCPFVTEYKHHLEYHLRNHFGSKPFKCTKCNYSCVNKSMLNSHLKSHSNIYQYRCADCAYATKYCHSLKLHLRKYDHSPAMVLNQDGSPNPLPIIDVYGTRRGPKQKPKPVEENEKSNLPGGVVVPAVPTHISDDPHAKLLSCSFCEFYTVSFEILNQHMYLHAAESPLAQMFRTNNNLPDHGAMKDYFQNVFLSMEPPASPLSLTSPHQSPMATQPASPLDLSKSDAETKDDKKPIDTKKNRRKGKAYKLERLPETDTYEEHAPFDLSREVKTESVSPSHVGYSSPVRTSPARFENSNSNDSGPSSPKMMKLTPPSVAEDCSPDDSFKIKLPPLKETENREKKIASPAKSEGEDYSCDFCQLAFKDVVMYTMHMGYHGYKDPFTCNMCGQNTPDKVAFFLHIARTSHT